MPDRVVIYISVENEEHAQEQMRQAQELCDDQRAEVVAVARELPGQTAAWDGAHTMIRKGEADRIVVASGSDVPDILESATGSLPGRGGRHRGASQRRTRPVRRDAGA